MSGTVNHRIVMVGNTAVGKTAIINQYVYGSSSSEHQPTVGIDFFAKTVKVGGRVVRLQLWDTAGQEKFHSLIPSYLRNATGAILVYDITNRESFEKLDFWHQFTIEQASPAFFIVGNKVDLEAARQVATIEGQKWAENHSAIFFETSATGAVNIAQLFQAVAESYVPAMQPPAQQAGKDERNAEQAAVEIGQATGGRCC
jgi:Ras-related protein Rab-6A